jgi:HSF-type DNA-binding
MSSPFLPSISDGDDCSYSSQSKDGVSDNGIESNPSYASSASSASQNGAILTGGVSDGVTVNGEYHDYRQQDAEMVQQLLGFSKGKRRGPRGGVVTPFPMRLYDMLDKVKDEGMEKVVSWQPHGRCFVVRRPNDFVKDILPR